MIGNNILIINHATLLEALNQYFNKELSKEVKIVGFSISNESPYVETAYNVNLESVDVFDIRVLGS